MSSIIPKKYVVIYLDFLGQKDFFGQIKGVKIDAELNKKVAYVSDSVRSGFLGFRLLAEKMAQESEYLYKQLVDKKVEPYVSAPKEWFQYELKRCKAKVHSFSDGTMVYFPLNEDIAQLLMSSVMLYLCRFFLGCLFEGSIYRGGITFGDGWEIEDGVLYGPVVDRVAVIESKIASYPRIVIADEIYDYFDRVNIQCLSPNIIKLIEPDSDGAYVLNYLSLEFLNSPILGQDRKNVWEFVRYMHWYVRDQLRHFRDSGNIKMFQRYRFWDAYSFRHEMELRGAGILQDAELEKGSSHPKLGSYSLGEYLVIYLQFQPDPLRRLGYDGDIDNATVISSVAKEIDAVHGRLKKHARGMLKEQFGAALTEEEIDMEATVIENAPCGTIQMSNYLLCYVRNIGYAGGHYFGAWLLQMKFILRNMATNGVFARGSIDYGVGWELEPGLLYGPVIQSAARLESQVAGYPRIVIGERIVQELAAKGKEIELSGKSPEKENLVFQYIKRDEDFAYIFDYLNLGEDDISDKLKYTVADIEKGCEVTHQLGEEMLTASRRNGLVNPRISWPALALNMYFRRKLSDAQDVFKEVTAQSAKNDLRQVY